MSSNLPMPQPQYRPGDVVNGHVLGEDLQWYPLPAPAPPPPPQVHFTAQQTMVNARRGVNHPLHLVLSIVTCGLWIPVWLVIVIIDSIDKR